MERLRHLLILVTTVGLAACTAPTASETPLAATSPVATSAIASRSPVASPAPTATPVAEAVPGGQPLVVWQGNGATIPTTTASTVSVLDRDGHRRDIIDFPETDSTWPARIDVTNDGDRAFLFGPGLRGSVDLETGTMTRRPFTVPPFSVAASHDGRHLAWVDDVTGAAVTIVVADASGKHPMRLDLPPHSWYAWPEWTPDDQAILATVAVPIRPQAAGGIVLAETSRGDPGPLAAHVVLLPVDGSPMRDLADDAAAVVLDTDGMAPLPASVDLPKAVTSTHEILQATLAPDGSRLAYLQVACWSEKFAGLGHTKSACSDQVIGVRLDGSAPAVLADDLPTASALAWSADGRTLVVRGTDRSGRAGLFQVDPAGATGPSLLLATTPDDPTFSETWSSVHWSPDGAWLRFGRGVDTWLVRADGSDAHVLVANGTAGW
jgi:hypothetical protein